MTNTTTTDPISLQTSGEADNTYLEQRCVSFWLLLGIVFIPFIFVWATLRKGHTALSRIGAFAWLFMYIYANAGSHLGASQAAGTVDFSAVTTMSCRTDGTMPGEWDSGHHFMNFLANGKVVMNMKEELITVIGDYTASGGRLELTFNGGVDARGNVSAFAARRQVVTGARIVGHTSEGDTQIVTDGFQLKCILPK